MAYVPMLNVQRHVNDPTDWGTSASRGLIAGLKTMQQRGDDERTFRNDVAQRGGTLIETDSPERQRLNEIASKWRKRPTWIGGTGGHATDEEAADAEANTRGAPAVGVTPNYGDDDTAAPPRAMPAPRTISGAIAQATGSAGPGGLATQTPQPGQNLASARDGTSVGTAQPVRRSGGIGALLDQATAGVHPYEVEGPNGMRASIDPMYSARVSNAGKMMDYGFERATRRSEKDESDQDAIDALVAGGVPPTEARARVLTGTVKYDEQYGQRARGTAGMTFDQRVQFETIRQRNMMERVRLTEGLRTARKNNDPVAAQRFQTQMRALDQRDREIALRLGGIELGAERDPSGIAAVVESSTPEGKAAATARGQRRAGIVEGLKKTVAAPGSASGGASGGAPGGAAKPSLGARMAQLKAAHTPAAQAKQTLIHEGYTLPKGW